MSSKQEGVRERESRVDRAIYMPATDVYENDDSVVLVMDMPGVDDEHVKVTLEDNVLTVEGQRIDSSGDDYQPLISEYEPGDYRRSFTVPADIRTEGIEARIANGVLKVILPKSEKARPRQIEVKAE